jgi:hypothetical protein
MAKLTVNSDQGDSAPQPLPATVSDVVTDSSGRRLKIAQPDILNESRLVSLLGEAAANQAYMVGYVLPAVMVTAIDDNDIHFPTTKLQVEAQIKRLGRHGLQAVMDHLTAQAGTAEGAEDGIKK